jgi:hypothetical protein
MSYVLFMLLAMWAQVPVLLLVPRPALVIFACIAVVELLVREWQQDQASAEAIEPEDPIDDWHVTDLARAHAAAHTAGNREVRDLIEGVLEDLEPGWRLYA